MFADPSSVTDSTMDVGVASPGATHFFLVRWCFPGWPTNLMPFGTETLTWTCENTGHEKSRLDRPFKSSWFPVTARHYIICAGTPLPHIACSPKSAEYFFLLWIFHAAWLMLLQTPWRTEFRSSSNFHRGLNNAQGSINCSLFTCHKS